MDAGWLKGSPKQRRTYREAVIDRDSDDNNPLDCRNCRSGVLLHVLSKPEDVGLYKYVGCPRRLVRRPLLLSFVSDLTTARKACIWVVAAVASLLSLGGAYHAFQKDNADISELEATETALRAEDKRLAQEAARERQVQLQTQQILNQKIINIDTMNKIKFWKSEIRTLEFQWEGKSQPLDVRLHIDEMQLEVKQLELLLQRNG